MWAGRSSTSRTRVHSLLSPSPSSSSSSSSSSWSMMSVLVLFCCMFLVVVDIEVVTAMSLDRLGIDRSNELQSDKNTEINENRNSDLVVEDVALEAVPAKGETEMYVLLPAGSKSERESVDKNMIENNEAEPSNVAEIGGDMIMMESNNEPVVQIANLPPPKASEVILPEMHEVNVAEDRDNEDEPTTSDESDDEPIKQVFKNDKDIEDMAIENDVNKEKDSGEEAGPNDDEPESMVEMLADVVEEVEKEIETELVGEDTDASAANKVLDAKDEEKDKWEATVEKLEEKGSEKNKADDNDIELEAAAVMEEILPEEIVEAMAVADASATSSEENEEEDNDKDKNKEGIKIQNNRLEKPQEIENQTPEKQHVDNVKGEDQEENTDAIASNGEDKEQEGNENNSEAGANAEADTSKLEETNEVEETATEALKDEQPNVTTVEIEGSSAMSEETNKEESPNTSQKDDEPSDAEKPLDNIVEATQEEHQNLNPNEQEKEEASNTAKEEDKDEETAEHISNEVETAAEEEAETSEATDEKIAPDAIQETAEVMQSEVADKTEANKITEDTQIPSDADDQKKEHEPISDMIEPPQPVAAIQADEVPLTPPANTIDNENTKDGEMETIEVKPTESTNGIENVEGEAEVDPPTNTIQQMEESINKSEENKDTEDMPIPDKPSENVPSSSSLEIQPNTEEQASKETLPVAEDTTMLTTILQMPALQQPQQNQLQQLQQDEQQQHAEEEATHNEMHAATDTNGQNEQLIGDVVATTQMTVESTTQKTQDVISATQDAVLNYVNATNAMHPSNDEKDQKKQPTQHDNESDAEASFNSQLRRYDGAQVWRIVVQNDRDRRLADELQSKYDGQLWKEVRQEVDYLLKPQVLAAAEKHIRAANLSRIVLIDNLQQVIEVENPALDEFADADNEKGHRLTWHAYHRLADIHEFYDYLAKTYPEICSVETIGYSVQRRPLKVLKISNGNAGNPGVWIDGGMHAREWISPASVTYIANQLAEGWEDLPSYMRNVNWFIHAVANPDGYEYTHTTDRLWRKNLRSHGRQCPGVDLNRNFGFKWGGKGTSANPCSQIYRGSKAFSEPETFYISKFLSGFPRDTFQAYLSFHSYGQYILYPWGYDYQLTNDKSDLDRVARAAATTITRSSGSKYTVGPSAVTLYPAAGGSDDWAKGIANIKYTYTIEMGDNGRYGFILPADQIETNGRDAYTFVQTVARAISHDARKRTIKLK